MTDQLLSAVRQGALVLTANQRLSRSLRRLYDEHQMLSGSAVWPAAPILPFSGWLRNRWAEAITNGVPHARMLLNSDQEQTLWTQVIEASPESARLLQIRATAASAMQAWKLVHQYRLPWSQFDSHEDAAAFRSWARLYRDVCDRRRWTDEARLPDVVLQSITEAIIDVPHYVLLAGFDELTPQQENMIDTLTGAGCHVERMYASARRDRVQCVELLDGGTEIREAARWARSWLEREPESRIGVVIPSLQALRGRVDQIFTEVVHPHRLWFGADGGRAAFHISMGKPLSSYPVIRAALLIAGMDPRAVSIDQIGRLLRSPFVAGATSEASARASLDGQLRRLRTPELPLRSVLAAGTLCPLMTAVLGDFEQWSERVPAMQKPSEWARDFSQALTASGWPGGETLSSAEYQEVQAWRGLLSRFASLDLAVPAISRFDAAARLREMAADTEFQPQDEDAPIQVMGALEAAGAEFDHLWILGLHDEVWPGPAHPHPFLPISLQREHDLPHCSSDRELDFTRRTMERLLASAPDITVSYPRRDGDRDLRPSALLDDLPRRNSAPASGDGWMRLLHSRGDLESIHDATGPPLAEKAVAGGTSVLKNQAACPFRAFAEIRLGARGLDDPALGFDALQRGNAVHRALEYFWRAVRSHAELMALTPEKFEEIIAGAAREALDQTCRQIPNTPLHRRFRALEEQRLIALLREWMQVEKARAAFTVVETEGRRRIAVDGIEINARIDRVDELADGRHIIVDYKASAPSLAAWLDHRPEEPQVPLYSIAADRAVAAVAFAQLTPGSTRFKGFADAGGVLPGIKAFHETREGAEYSGLSDRVEAWRSILSKLASDFREGRAAVDPKHGRKTCERCSLGGMCRVGEGRLGTE